LYFFSGGALSVGGGGIQGGSGASQFNLKDP